MKEEEINKRIAEACGWTECRLVAKVVLSVLRDPVAYGVPPNRTYEIACLSYCVDLNAMHEAENICINTAALEEEYYHFINRNFRATARQRAEAFLRTIGKWEEAE